MTRDQIVALIAALPDGVQLTLSVSKADLVHALERRDADPAPANLDTRQAAARYGYTAERWRRWAEAGKIAGAWQDAPGGSWHLPLAACEAHIRALQHRGRTPAGRSAPVVPSPRSVPRGPRRSRPQPDGSTRVPTGPRGAVAPIALESSRGATA